MVFLAPRSEIPEGLHCRPSRFIMLVKTAHIKSKIHESQKQGRAAPNELRSCSGHSGHPQIRVLFGWRSSGNRLLPLLNIPRKQPLAMVFLPIASCAPSSNMTAPGDRDIIEALRATLQTLESTTDPNRDEDAVAHLLAASR